ncbi:MAG: hypothetical protein OHK0022_48780 [Roseiflexaceae bacterium]
MKQALDHLDLQQNELKSVGGSKDVDKEEEKTRFIEKTFGSLRDSDVEIWPEGPFETRESIE